MMDQGKMKSWMPMTNKLQSQRPLCWTTPFTETTTTETPLTAHNSLMAKSRKLWSVSLFKGQITPFEMINHLPDIPISHSFWYKVDTHTHAYQPKSQVPQKSRNHYLPITSNFPSMSETPTTHTHPWKLGHYLVKVRSLWSSKTFSILYNEHA